MKSYEEIAQNIFRRRDDYLAEKKRKRAVLIKCVGSCAGVGAAALVAFGIWRSSTVKDMAPSLDDDPYSSSVEFSEPTDSSGTTDETIITTTVSGETVTAVVTSKTTQTSDETVTTTASSTTSGSENQDDTTTTSDETTTTVTTQREDEGSTTPLETSVTESEPTTTATSSRTTTTTTTRSTTKTTTTTTKQPPRTTTTTPVPPRTTTTTRTTVTTTGDDDTTMSQRPTTTATRTSVTTTVDKVKEFEQVKTYFPSVTDPMGVDYDFDGFTASPTEITEYIGAETIIVMNSEGLAEYINAEFYRTIWGNGNEYVAVCFEGVTSLYMYRRR